MTAQTTETMYREQPIGEWLDFLPEDQQRLVEVPPWATECYAEGWTEPDTGAWIQDGVSDGRMDFWFSMPVESRRIKVFSGAHGHYVPMTIKLSVRGYLTRTDGIVRDYRQEAVRVVFWINDGGIDLELDVNSANLMLSALGEALTPVAPATLAAVRAERRRAGAKPQRRG
jgi:hypothetical protein